MRTLLLTSVLALVAAASGQGQAQAGRNTAYIAANVERTLTITRSGVVLTTLTFPRGTMISVTYDVAGSVLPATDGRFAFRGNVEIRAMAVSQKPNQTLEAAMLSSPIDLTASDVDVAIVPR
jgi:hypothetical protein